MTMDKDKKEKAISNINKEISKIDKKENQVFFFVIDTKGVPSGSLEYIYQLAKIVKDEGYDVTMLHTEEEFVGVESWLGKEFSSIKHLNVNGGEVATTPSDVLFIPEIYAQVMNQTKNLPCKRVAILQNYDYVVEQMPFSAQWGDLGIMNGISNSDYMTRRLLASFPYVKMQKVTPFVSDMFRNDNEPKKMIVNVISKYQDDIKKIVKPFYWKHNVFKWVTFRELRNDSKEEFAKKLREGAITIIVDDNASFMYSALEAMKSGSIVMCKLPDTELEWMYDEEGKLRNCCVWFDDYDMLHKQIASVVRAWITDRVPTKLAEEADKVLKDYTYDRTKTEFLKAFNSILEQRKNEMKNLLTNLDKEEEK